MQYVAEHFDHEEQDVLRPYFTNLDGPVFALVNLPEVVKGALFARYSRSDKSLRRLFLDEFVGDLDITGDLTDRREHRAQARRGALRPRVPRVRRRLGRAARRRAPRVRAGVEPAHEGARVGPAHGLPRAVDALHRVRQPPRRSLPLPTGRPRSSSRRSARATSARSTRCSRSYTESLLPTCSSGRARGTRRRRATRTSSTSRPSRRRRSTRVRGILPAATLSNVGIYGTGQGYEQLLLRMRGAPAARGPPLRRPDARRAPQGRPVVPHPGRPARARAAPGASTSRRPGTTPPPSCTGCSADEDARAAARRDAHRLRSRRRGQGARRDLLPAHERCPRTRSWRGCARSAPTSACRCSRRTSGSAPTAATSPGARSSAPATASTSSPTTARSAICNAIACSRSNGSRSHPKHGYDVPEPVGRGGRARPSSCKAMDVSAALLRRDGVPLPRAGVVRGVARVPAALRHADERARGDAPHRAAHDPAGASVRTDVVAQEMHRLIARAGRSPGHRRGDELRRPRGLRARAVGLGACCCGPPRGPFVTQRGDARPNDRNIRAAA